MNDVEFTFDAEVGMFYLKLSNEDSARTIRIGNQSIWIDLDAAGNIAGIEFATHPRPEKARR
jgi:uncharacterized protein YuzE